MGNGDFWDTSVSLLGRARGHLVYDAFGNVTSETNPTVDFRSNFAIGIPRPARTWDCSPVGFAFLFTARPMVVDTKRRVNVSEGAFDAETKRCESFAPGAVGQESTPKNLNRWYDASVGRWLSEDPVGFDGGDGNLYRYCGNNPAAWDDPTGQQALGPALPIAGACAAADGPAPIGDVAAGVIIVGAICYDVGVIVVDVCQNHGCYPCIPAVGMISYQGPDTTHTHFPFVNGPHHHLYWMSRSPWSMCKCFWTRWGTVGSLPPGLSQ